MSGISGTLNPFTPTIPRLEEQDQEVKKRNKLKTNAQDNASSQDRQTSARQGRTSLLSGGDNNVDTFNQRIITG